MPATQPSGATSGANGKTSGFKAAGHGTGVKSLTSSADKEARSQIRSLIILVITLLLSAVLSSVICWFVTYDSSRFALKDLAQQLQKEVASAIDNQLFGNMRPVEMILKQGLEFCYDEKIDLTTFDGQRKVIPFVKSFLVQWGSTTRCCTGIFTNMEYYPPSDIRNNENDLYHPNPMMTILIYFPDGTVKYWYPQNRSTPVSRMIYEEILYDNRTRLVDYSSAPTQGAWFHWPRNDGVWYNHTRGLNGERGGVPMKPGDFGFSRVFPWTLNNPITLKMHGMVPIFKNPNTPNRPIYSPRVGVDERNLQLVGTWVIGFKLKFFTPYLADLPAIKAKKGIIVYVEKSTGVYIGSSIKASADLTANNTLLNALEHPDVRVRSRAKAVGINPPHARFGSWEATLEDEENFVYSYNMKQYDLDWVGILTFPKAAVMEQVTNKIASNLVIGILSVAGLNIVLILAVMSGVFWKLRALTLKKEQADIERIQTSVDGNKGFSYPMVTLRADRFFLLGRLRYHEELRDACMLTFFDDPTIISSVKIALLSHQWLGWTQADPENYQYPAMVAAVRQLLDQEGLEPTQLYLWVDTFSIPQANGIGAIQNAIDSLTMYASLSTYLVVVAPPAAHSNTEEPCNLDSYMKRCWCRAEQASHILVNGTSSYYIMDTQDGKLRVGGGEGIDAMSEMDTQCLFIFEGNLTCCQRKHPGGIRCDRERLVDAMLGLLHKLTQEVEGLTVDSEKYKLYRFIVDQQQRLFPAEIKMETEDGKIVTKELFGGLLNKMSHMSSRGSLTSRPSKISVIRAAETATTKDKQIVRQEIVSLKNRIMELELRLIGGKVHEV